jgi:hypothetical protein
VKLVDASEFLFFLTLLANTAQVIEFETLSVPRGQLLFREVNFGFRGDTI